MKTELQRKHFEKLAEREAAKPKARRRVRPKPPPKGVFEFAPSDMQGHLSEMPPAEWWDEANNCRHGRLPAEACAPCGRRSTTYPGVHAVARAEARLMGALPRNVSSRATE